MVPDAMHAKRSCRTTPSEELTMADKRITDIEDRIEALSTQIQELQGQLAELELDQWRGRIDDLEVQLHLGAMAGRDRLAPLVEKLRNSYLDARESVTSTASSAGDMSVRIRKGLEQAMNDIRKAVLDDDDEG